MIIEGIVNILATTATFIVSFIGGILDNFLFQYLPNVSLMLGYIGAFFNLILNNLAWILDLTGINYDYWTIILGLYLLRFILLPVAFLWKFIYSMIMLFKS